MTSKSKEEEYERLREKAKRLRFKRPIAKEMNLWYIRTQCEEMAEACSEVEWFVEDDENLVAALSGDDDDAFGFKMSFVDLSADLERFMEDLNEDLLECFDELFPASGAGEEFGGYQGYDNFEGDYYGLEPFEYGSAEKEAQKRILRMTKQELLDAVGACLRVYQQYVNIKYRYDCLSMSLDILRQKNMSVLKTVKAIEEQYIIAERESEHFSYKSAKAVQDLDRLLREIPQEYWIQ